MSDIEQSLFATKHIKTPSYWNANAVASGSSYFQTNSQKLTRSSFDELVQLIDQPATSINTSTLLDVERAKTQRDKYILKDISNVDDIADIDEAKRNKVVEDLGLISLTEYQQQLNNGNSLLLPKYESGTLTEVKVVVTHSDSVRVQTTKSDSTAVLAADINSNFSIQEDSYNFYTIPINESCKYFYIAGELNADNYHHAIAILQQGTSPYGFLKLELSITIPKIKYCIGETMFHSLNGCFHRFVLQPSITEEGASLSSVYQPYQVTEKHGHSTGSVELIDTTTESNRWKSNTTSTSGFSGSNSIAKCFLELGKIGYTLSGTYTIE